VEACPRLVVAKLICHLPIILFFDITVVPIAHLAHQFTPFNITGKIFISKAFARRQFTFFFLKHPALIFF
jgi:hypothetical protein